MRREPGYGKKPLHLLILEDNPDDAELAVKELEREGFTVEWSRVDTEKAFRKALDEKPDLILTDYKLPSFSGLAALEIRRKLAADIPSILISGTIGEEVAVECMKAGATDYVLKDRLSRLVPVVKRALKEAEEHRARKQAEEELIKTRERLELAMDAGEHGFWDWNLDTDDVYFSPRYYTMLGYEPGELPMKLETWVNLMHPDDQKTIVPEVENYVKNAQPYEVEFRLKTKDGNWKWISGRGKSYEKDKDGVPHRAIGVHVDITERKKTEEALNSSEGRLRILFEFAPDAYYLNDLKGTFIDGNKAAEDLMGYKREELIGKSFLKLKLISKKEMLKASKLLMKNVLGKGTGPDEFILNRKDGSQVSVEIRTYPVKVEGKTVVLGIARDITERKRAEEALRESETKYRRIFENIQNVYYESSLDGTILEISPSVENVSKYNRKELIGRSLYDIYTTPEERDEFVKIILDKGKVNDFEISLTDKDGSQHPCSVTALLMKDEQGNPIKFIGSMHDISERKQAEEEKKKLQAQLLQVQKMEAIGILAGGVAHDFNNILTAISGYADLAMMKLDEADPLYRDLKQIDISSTRAASLTRQLLLFSRRQPMEFTSFNLNTTVNNLLKMLQRLI
ncbi:MAG: PAS domain S-box protein, partial [Deltaproteobacteria bacterium]|nr:PAS domain S-box protein [Deltaproteobacteria bacterium]